MVATSSNQKTWAKNPHFRYNQLIQTTSDGWELYKCWYVTNWYNLDFDHYGYIPSWDDCFLHKTFDAYRWKNNKEKEFITFPDSFQIVDREWLNHCTNEQLDKFIHLKNYNNHVTAWNKEIYPWLFHDTIHLIDHLSFKHLKQLIFNNPFSHYIFDTKNLPQEWRVDAAKPISIVGVAIVGSIEYGIIDNFNSDLDLVLICDNIKDKLYECQYLIKNHHQLISELGNIKIHWYYNSANRYSNYNKTNLSEIYGQMHHYFISTEQQQQRRSQLFIPCVTQSAALQQVKDHYEKFQAYKITKETPEWVKQIGTTILEIQQEDIQQLLWLEQKLPKTKYQYDLKSLRDFLILGYYSKRFLQLCLLKKFLNNESTFTDKEKRLLLKIKYMDIVRLNKLEWDYLFAAINWLNHWKRAD